MARVFIFLGLLALSIFLCLFIKDSTIDSLIEKLIFNAIAVLVGLSIAVIGIFLSSLNSIYLSLHKIVKSGNRALFTEEEIVQIKDSLSELVDELKGNCLFSLYAFVGAMALVFSKEADIPYIKWFVESHLVTKAFVFNILILFTTFLIFYSIIDSIKAAFKISTALELIRED